MATKLKVQNTLALHSFTLTLIDSVVKEVQQLPEYKSKKLDNELTKSVCKLVRDEIISSIGVFLTYSQASTLDKRAIIVEALRKCFDLSEEEASLIESQVEFFLDNKLVKTKAMASIFKAISRFFRKK